MDVACLQEVWLENQEFYDIMTTAFDKKGYKIYGFERSKRLVPVLVFRTSKLDLSFGVPSMFASIYRFT